MLSILYLGSMFRVQCSVTNLELRTSNPELFNLPTLQCFTLNFKLPNFPIFKFSISPNAQIPPYLIPSLYPTRDAWNQSGI